VNTAQAVAQQIIQQGYFSRPYMGISFQPITPDIADRYNLPVKWGAYVTQVDSGSPAAQAGLVENDIITRVGDITLDDTHSYINALFTYKPGDTIPIVVMRNGNETQLQVTLGEAQHQ
jgi:serine protease Do